MSLHRYLGHYVAAGDGSASARAAGGIEIGAEATVEAIDVAADVQAAGGIEIGAEATVSVVAVAAAAGGIEVGSEAFVSTNVVEAAAEGGIEIGAAATVEVEFEPAQAGAAGGIEIGAGVTLTLAGLVRVAGGIELGTQVVYTGPGTGVEVGPKPHIPIPGGSVVIDARDPLGHLREGDVQQVVLPWAGIAGQTGIARIMARSIRDESARQAFRAVHFEPQPDPAAVGQLARGVTPQYVPPERGDAAGLVQRQRREIERIQRRRR